jgi:hypothetical protein
VHVYVASPSGLGSSGIRDQVFSSLCGIYSRDSVSLDREQFCRLRIVFSESPDWADGPALSTMAAGGAVRQKGKEGVHEGQLCPRCLWTWARHRGAFSCPGVSHTVQAAFLPYLKETST